MRVLHILRPAAMGGAERHLMSTLPSLVDRGVDVRFVLLARPPGYAQLLDALHVGGVDVTILSPPGPHANPVTPVRFRRQVTKHRPDLVHTHSIDGDLYGGLAARSAGVPSVSTIHGTYPFYRRQPYLTAARAAGRIARRTIAISQHVVTFLRDTAIAPPDRIRLVPYGIEPVELPRDDALRAANGAEPADVVVVVASRLVEHKGHDALIDAIAAALGRAPSLCLWIAGDGPLRSALEARADRRLPEGRFRFLGFVRDIGSVLSSADVFAFPTSPAFGEGLPYAPLDAMAAGLPIVASRVDSLAEQVRDGETGVLVEPDDVASLAEALVALAADAGRRRTMGDAGRARVRERYPLAANVDGTLAVYREVLG